VVDLLRPTNLLSEALSEAYFHEMFHVTILNCRAKKENMLKQLLSR